MSDKTRLWFYILGSLAAFIWLGVSIVQSMQDGSLLKVSNIIFLLCLLVAAVYFLVSAIQLGLTMRHAPVKDKAEENADGD
ncbi:carbon starvation protein [Bifidobacterium sp. ESL0775]|uniref:carbon starvation protein n=1 Tax=Bifidobacterium sp. ESL0775 TaxID=2983230 RepID=UPI0023F6A800|nr:carbon starvation protein [Bifidobacterium sp. ESL0775]WEV68902.1 carbon starvation protein [Bifidobacterium sp. ESL0775]